jgi:hypothetical protein
MLNGREAARLTPYRYAITESAARMPGEVEMADYATDVGAGGVRYALVCREVWSAGFVPSTDR